MQTRRSATSLDAQIEEAFGRPITALRHDLENPAVRRVLEIRAMLAVVEQHLDQIRDRLHTATAPDRNCAELADEDLTVDAEWLAAAGRSRNHHAQAITSLLRAGPTASPRKQDHTATEATARSAFSPTPQASTTALPHR
ncbi:hypothetical protein ACFY0R_09985 [Streptomyces sp. NPDC001633]|uniref:hypothetical protein n=1 Tax=Streptomyces sp. NPDC001633 TaxID=3364595 RepID=UPI003682A90E